MNFRSLRRGALALAGVFVVALSSPAAATEPLVLATAQTSLSLPLFVADAQGFFAAEGLAVQLRSCLSGQRCLKQLLDGQAQLATASELPVVFNSFARDDFAIVGTFATSSRDLKLIARHSAGIDRPAQLAGKRIGTLKGSSAHYFLDTFLLFHDLDPKALQVIGYPPDAIPAAMQKGEIDAAAIFEPYGYLARKALGGDARELPSPRLYTETFNLIADRRSIDQRGNELARVLSAVERAERFIAENPREAQAVLRARLQLDQGFVDDVWGTLDYRLGLDHSLLGLLEGEARWALREGHVAADQRPPNYLRFIEPGPLSKALPSSVTLLK